MANSWLIRGGRVLDPGSGRDEVADLLVRDGTIADPAAAGTAGVKVIDASGLVVTPGLIDLHVHFREPGGEAAETVESGAAAAAHGAFTTVVTMPNTTPATDTPQLIAAMLGRAKSCGKVRILPCGCITRERRGREPADLRAMAAAGAAAFSDDGDTVLDDGVMADAMRIAAELGVVVMDHALDPRKAGNGVMRQCPAATRLGLPGMPPEAESAMVERDIALAAETGCAVHIQHVSSATSVALIRSAVRAGHAVSGEVTPHHLALTCEDIIRPDANLKMNPPLGARDDRAALVAAIVDGTLQAFATDHAPHTGVAKARGFVAAPFGVVGLETAVGVTCTALVSTGLMPVMDWLRRWTTGPAKILGIPPPGLAPGRVADIAILDLESEWRVDSSTFLSQSTNTPFEGMILRGRAVHTLLGGRLTWTSAGA